ncbi:hypothetical protein B0H16DRAFT_1736125 [Mycena metata]|uniref:Uncharacterized protein n=1 Tax=Mycena metata TaxID=1033252 RepID=A0AAD7HR07_9AGAR|nr:hypothetical protein B0H16DRAFT_1736125 [Mycena metata]
MKSKSQNVSGRGVKIKNPFTFDGRVDLDIFDQWTYEVDTWREWHGISHCMTVKIMVKFVSGDASKFFMKHEELEANDVETASEGEGDDEDSSAAVEAHAARFTDQDIKDEMVNLTETDSSSSPEDSGTDGLQDLYSSAEDSQEDDSDLSDEYYVGTQRIISHSD